MNELERGRLAEEVLNNEVYQNAYSLIEQGIITKWRSETDKESRERLHLMLKLLDKLQQTMQGAMVSGQIERKALETKERRSLGQMFSPGFTR